MASRKSVGTVVLILGATLGVVGLSLIASPPFSPKSSDAPTGPKAPEKPSVVMLPATGQLRLHNNGNDPIGIWGTRWAGNLAMEKEPRTIAKGYYYYFLTDQIEQEASAKIPIGMETLVPLDVYIENRDKKKFTANFKVLVKNNGGNIEFHTQNIGVSDDGW